MTSRLASGILGLVLLALGAWMIVLLAWPEARLYLPTRAEFLNFAQSPVAAAIAVAVEVLGVILGLILIIANLRPYSIGEVEARMPSAFVGDNEIGGNIRINVAKIAEAEAKYLEQHPGISEVRTRCSSKPEPQAEIKIGLVEGASISEIKQSVRESQGRLRAAIGDTRLRLLFQLHF
ncbi:MAG: hypothetical protein Q3962_07205 [Corynebacterium sp.]|nr:hypothetical protein [Corynebacterium sp.]